MTDWNMSIFDDIVLSSAQQKVLELLREGLSQREIAKKLGKSKGTIGEHATKIRNKAANTSGTSILQDPNTGEKKLIWVKNKYSEHEMKALLKGMVESFLEDIPRAKAKKYDQKHASTDIVTWFQIGDAHIGMLAHEAEVGHNFDLKIAETELCFAITELVDRMPATERCVINDLGDASHYENMQGMTQRSGHLLDYDTRFPKMYRVLARTYRFMIEACLTKFKYVDVIINPGNHSETNDYSSAIWLEMLYEKEPRVNILDNSCLFIPYRMGNTFVMTHHSHTCKPNKLAGVMANDFHQDWGETKYHYIDIGHVHHKSVSKEDNGAIVESFNQLAPHDKHAHDHGWRSRSFLTVIRRSKTYGEKGREHLTAEEVQDRLHNLPAGTSVAKRRKVYTV